MAEWTTISSTHLTEEWRFDSEYWRPIYLDNLKMIRAAGRGGLSTCQLKKVVTKVTGSAFYPSFVGYYSQKGIPFLRVADLGSLFLKRESMIRIDPAIISNHHQISTIRPGDIVIAKGGSIGGACILTDDFGESAVCRDVVAVLTSPDGVDPFYLAVFLNTKFGNLQLERNKSQQVQAHLTFPAVERIELAFPDTSTQQEVRNIALAGYAAQQDSHHYYTKALQLLESELGLDKLSFKKPMGYTARLSELEESRRSDPQHYQPKFNQLISHLSKLSTRRVRDIRTYNRRGIQPAYMDGGQFDVVNSQHLGPKHINYEELQKISAGAFAASPEAHIRPNDILIYTTGAYVGRTNVYLKDTPAFASNHVNILRLAPGIDTAYMSLVFQSVVGQFQTLKHSRGSAQAELYPADIDRFIVPVIVPAQQKRIGNLVRESLKKQQDSKQLLEKAKTRVEQLIEEAVER